MRSAKRSLKTNGRLANRWLTSFVYENKNTDMPDGEIDERIFSTP